MWRAGLLAVTLGAGSATAGDRDGSPPYSNLQVLPADISTQQILDVMKLMTRSLGVTCSYCHRSDSRDYASDEMQAKRLSRDMMRLVEKLNAEGVNWRNPPVAVCAQCHKGQARFASPD